MNGTRQHVHVERHGSVGNANARHLHSNFELDEVVLISDLAQKSPVLQWDGTTLSEMTHNLSATSSHAIFEVENERVFYANVKSGSATPHVIVGSGRSDYDNLSVTNRPSSGLNAGDPFFLNTPDLRYINGIVIAFGRLSVSTRDGRFFPDHRQ